MGMIMDSIAEWLKEILVGGIISNLSGMFDSVNGQVGEIAVQVGTTPQAWNGTIYSMIRTLSENVMVPIAGVILAFVMTLELIQMVADKNNMHGDVDTWMFFKWIFKTAASVLIVTNTWNIVMGVFDVGQSVVNSAAGVIASDASIGHQLRHRGYGEPADGDGSRTAVRSVVPELVCWYLHLGTHHLYFYHHLRAHD